MEKKAKKAYHSPKLSVCGSIEEQTLYGTGAIPDAEWTTASRLSP